MVHPASPLRPTQSTSSHCWDHLCILVPDGDWETNQRHRLWFVPCMGHYQALLTGPVATITYSCFFGRCHSSGKVNATCIHLQIFKQLCKYPHGISWCYFAGTLRSMSNMVFSCLIWTEGVSNIKLLCPPRWCFLGGRREITSKKASSVGEFFII